MFGFLRFSFLVVFAILRIACALFSVLFCILLMSKTSSLIQRLGKCPFCDYINFILFGVLVVWASLLLWSFHLSAETSSVFARYKEKWLQLNLTISVVLILSGVVALVMHGNGQQKMKLAVLGMVMVLSFLISIFNMSEYRSEFGPGLVISLVVFILIGLPFLGFIQPLFAISQLDNFNWGTRSVSQSTQSLTSAANNLSNHRKEKYRTWAFIYVLNIGVSVLATIGGDLIGIVLGWCFITAILVQLAMALIHNIVIARMTRNKREIGCNSDTE